MFGTIYISFDLERFYSLFGPFYIDSLFISWYTYPTLTKGASYMATENKSSIASLEQAKKLRLMEENKRLYGTFIRERRKSMGMKQEDLAKLVGVKTISVTQWEAGRTRPDVGNIIPLCTALKISPNDFFFGRISKSLLKPDEESLLINFRILPEHDKELLVAFAATMAEKHSAGMMKHCLDSFEKLTHSMNYAAAGSSTAMGDDESELVYVRKELVPRKTDLIITVSGHSMEPDFQWGDEVFVEETESLEIGEIGIFIVDDVGYIKQYFGNLLHSINPAENDIKLCESDNFRIVGRVLGKVPREAYPNKEEQAMLDEIDYESLRS